MNDSDVKFLENYKKRIVKELLKNICNDYKVYDTNDNIVDKDILYDQLMVPKVIKRCVGVTNTNPISQCTKKALDNYDYCKTHLSKMCFNKNEKEKEYEDDIFITLELNNTHEHNMNLKKKFIEDSFYLVDNKFIYDNSYKKVGYIDTEFEETKYILTDDPFILENMQDLDL